MLVPMHLSRILIREMADMQVIELSETGGERKFPIVIGLPEAFAIDRRIKGVQIPRPQTHDLLAEVIRALGGTMYLVGFLIMTWNLLKTAMAGKAVEVGFGILQGRPAPEGRVLVPVSLITRDNIAGYRGWTNK